MRTRTSLPFYSLLPIPYSLILLAAVALRFWGLRWGIPNSLHSYSYHPDEFLIIGATGSVLFGFFPRFYNYPSLFIYLVAGAVAAASTYGMAHSTGDAYLTARVMSALTGVGAVAVTYWAAKSLWDRGTGLMAAVVLCIAPLHVQHSHFATVDVPSTLFVAACLGFAGLVLSRGSWRDYILCGVMAGLAGGTKYNAGLVVFSVIAAHVLGSRERGAGLRRLRAALGCAVAAFVISTPGSILRWSEFIRGITYEMHHTATGHGLVFAGTGNGFVYTFMTSLWYGLGPAFAILFAVAAICGLYRMDRKALTILAFAIPFYVLISISQVRFARYTLPLFPAAAMLIGWLIRDVWTRHLRAMRFTKASVLALAFVGTLLYTIALDSLFVQPPPQDRALGWMLKSVPPGRSSIGVVGVPWFYSPPYSPAVGLGTLDQRREAMRASAYRLDVLHAPTAVEPLSRPPWVVLSDYEVSDAERIARSNPKRLLSAAPEWQAEYEWADCIARLISTHYVKRATFSDSLSSLGISFGSTQSLPHDMRYPAPTIWVYELKK